MCACGHVRVMAGAVEARVTVGDCELSEMDAGTEPRSSGSSAQTLNHWPISPALYILFLRPK